jgi:transcriptional regulator with XRE-family HTH domain
VSPAQLRITCAALKLTVREIEQATCVNKDSVSRYEAGGDILASALQKLEKLFLDAGIIFPCEEASAGVGIRLRAQKKSRPAQAPRPQRAKIGK